MAWIVIYQISYIITTKQTNKQKKGTNWIRISSISNVGIQLTGLRSHQWRFFVIHFWNLTNNNSRLYYIIYILINVIYNMWICSCSLLQYIFNTAIYYNKSRMNIHGVAFSTVSNYWSRLSFNIWNNPFQLIISIKFHVSS